MAHALRSDQNPQLNPNLSQPYKVPAALSKPITNISQLGSVITDIIFALYNAGQLLEAGCKVCILFITQMGSFGWGGACACGDLYKQTQSTVHIVLNDWMVRECVNKLGPSGAGNWADHVKKSFEKNISVHKGVSTSGYDIIINHPSVV